MPPLIAFAGRPGWARRGPLGLQDCRPHPALQRFWAEQGCVILQPYDMEMGAGTFHPGDHAARARAQAVERRLCAALAPAQGRPLRREPQPAAALLPVPGDPEAVAADLQELYLKSLGRDRHRSRSCTTSASSRTTGKARRSAPGAGLGVLVRRHGSVAVHLLPAGRGVECAPVAGELTYGLERLAMYVQGVDRVYDLNFNGREGADKVTYGDVFLQAEQEYSRHNFEYADTDDAVRAVQDGREGLQEISRAGGARSNRKNI
jgi:glycyl-tRNA synthetase alpha chain